MYNAIIMRVKTFENSISMCISKKKLFFKICYAHNCMYTSPTHWAANEMKQS